MSIASLFFIIIEGIIGGFAGFDRKHGGELDTDATALDGGASCQYFHSDRCFDFDGVVCERRKTCQFFESRTKNFAAAFARHNRNFYRRNERLDCGSKFDALSVFNFERRHRQRFFRQFALHSATSCFSSDSFDYDRSFSHFSRRIFAKKRRA